MDQAEIVGFIYVISGAQPALDARTMATKEQHGPASCGLGARNPQLFMCPCGPPKGSTSDECVFATFQVGRLWA